jgi:hypothetical protein
MLPTRLSLSGLFPPPFPLVSLSLSLSLAVSEASILLTANWKFMVVSAAERKEREKPENDVVWTMIKRVKEIRVLLLLRTTKLQGLMISPPNQGKH